MVTPLVTTRLSDQSMSENADSRPLTRGTVSWAQDELTSRSADLRDPRLDLLPRPDLAGLPPATVVLAEIDPLRSQGEALAAALQSGGVPTSIRTFPGATHDFFGLGGSVPEAAAAEEYAAQTLKIALTRDVPPVIPAPRARRGLSRRPAASQPSRTAAGQRAGRTGSATGRLGCTRSPEERPRSRRVAHG